ncbi:MAG: flagellar biosynthetic protein FliO [Methylococcales bacterium]
MKQRMFAMAIVLISQSLGAQAALTANPKAAPVLPRSELVEWAMGLGLVIFLILIFAWILRRLNQLSYSHGQRLKILGGISVGSRERVVLLQVGGKQLLLGVAPGRVETLHVLEPSELTRVEEGKPDDSTPVAFADRIKQAMRGS